ncbi:PQQ-binding-like beta-propeller repeat protein [Candidatus Fermentibacteria bacterium]|nr:PQQ-binding-like beta-propeller repeat protein [Candidatus Fermentibacteria bacterium]
MNKMLVRMATCLPAAALMALSAGAAPWPAPRHNPENTAFSGRPAALHRQPVLRWRLASAAGSVNASYLAVGDLDGDDSSEIVTGAAPTSAGSDSGMAWAVNGQGSLVWSTPLDGYVKWASPVLLRIDGDTLPDVVVGASSWSSLFALRGFDGDTLWTALESLAQVGMNAGDLDSDGNTEIVVADYQSPRHVRCINRFGGVEWTVTTSGTTYNIPAIGHLGELRGAAFTAHAAGWRERLYFVDAEGGVIWSYLASPTREQLDLTPPELGYLPDYGYVSAILADFDGDALNEIGFGTDLNYYVLEQDGALRWKRPTGITGTGFTALLNAGGDTVSFQDHHYQVMDAAVVDLDGDGSCDVVYGLGSDWWGRQVQGEPATLEVTEVVYRNAMVARGGLDGRLLWQFDALHPCLETHGRGRMGEPVACLVGGDVVVIAGSNDGYLYAVHGSTGALLWELWGDSMTWRRGMALADLDGDGLDELIVARGGGIEAWSSLASPVVSALTGQGGVQLSWFGDSASEEWRIYRCSGAHAPQGELLATLPAGVTTLTDPAPGFWQNPGLNAYYYVVGAAGTTMSGTSNRVGEFDWALSRGRPGIRDTPD